MTTTTNPITALRNMTRPSSNGYEVTVALIYHTATHYTWDAIRYPLDPHDRTPSEIVLDGTGLTWQETADKVSAYLTEHPDDGFWFI